MSTTKSDKNIEIKRLDYDFTICKVSDYSCVDLNTAYCFIEKTEEENSLVCLTNDVPQNVLEREDGWKAFYIHGILDFSMIGILSDIARILAEAGVSIFAVSTFNTDYVFVKEENYEKALELLEHQNYMIIASEIFQMPGGRNE